MHEIGSGPIENAYKEDMKFIGTFIDKLFNGDKKPKRVAFILMVFPFGEAKGRCNYMSNANREDVVTMLKEQLAYFSGMPETEGKG